MKTIHLEEFSKHSGIELHTLEQWVEWEWIVPAQAADAPALTDADAARAFFIHELRGDFGVNDEGVAIVLHLVDQLHGLRRALHGLRIELTKPEQAE